MKPEQIRAWLEPHFASDTSAAGIEYLGGSHGHCAVVALIVRMLLGGELVSATVNGQSHWFNRLEGRFDLDLTGDQFGLPPVVSNSADNLHHGARVRTANEINPETLARVGLLLSRAAANSYPEGK